MFIIMYNIVYIYVTVLLAILIIVKILFLTTFLLCPGKHKYYWMKLSIIQSGLLLT